MMRRSGFGSGSPQEPKRRLHVVYDGPGRAGKTESVLGLGRLLGRPVDCPAVDEAGRTLFFDWMEFRGGLVRGAPLECRVLTVPGQVVHSRRRIRLLRKADAVIFVADSRPGRFGESLRMLSQLQEILGSLQRRVPVLIQLNHRDHPQCLEEEEARRQLASWFAGEAPRIVSSVASANQGIREALVLAVGAAVRDADESSPWASTGGVEAQTSEELALQLVHEDAYDDMSL